VNEIVAAQRDPFEGVSALEPISLPLLDSVGCVLASDVTAPHDVPAFPTVAIDGYGLRAGDLTTRAELRVVDVVPAGFRASESYRIGTCIRVSRGAPLPEGLDTVVALSNAQVTESGVLLDPTPAGHGFIRAGAAFRAGSVISSAGRLIDADLVGTLAHCGVRAVSVHPRPRVLVLTVGTEYVEPGVPTPVGLVSDHLSFLAAALVTESGATAFRVPPVLDDVAEILDVVDDNAHRSDLIVLCGIDEGFAGALAEALGLACGDTARGEPAAFGIRMGAAVLCLADDPDQLRATAREFLPAVFGRLMGRDRA